MKLTAVSHNIEYDLYFVVDEEQNVVLSRNLRSSRYEPRIIMLDFGRWLTVPYRRMGSNTCYEVVRQILQQSGHRLGILDYTHNQPHVAHSHIA